jgi:hypothetical protein
VTKEEEGGLGVGLGQKAEWAGCAWWTNFGKRKRKRKRKKKWRQVGLARENGPKLIWVADRNMNSFQI